MTTANNTKLFWLEIVKATAIIMVVMVHNAAFGLLGPVGTKAWWINNVFDSVTRPGVPLFLMVSGALLLDGSKYAGIGDFFRRRFNRLCLPMLGWSLFYLYVAGGMESLTLTTCYVPFLTIFSRPTFFHLSFLYYLIGLYLIVPILQKFVASAKHGDYVYFLSAWFVFNSLVRELTFFTGYSIGFTPMFLLNYSGYLVAGYYFVNIFQPGNAWKPLYNWILGFIWLGSVCFTIYFTGTVSKNIGVTTDHFYDYSSFNVVISAFCIFILYKQIFANCESPAFFRMVILSISSAAFGIYLVHPTFIVFWHLDAMIMNLSGRASIIMIPLLTIAVLLGSMTCIWISGYIPFFRLFWGLPATHSRKSQSSILIGSTNSQSDDDVSNKRYRSAA